MHRRAALGVGVLLLLAGGCGMEELVGGGERKKAEKRLDSVLDVVSRFGVSESVEFQTAICRFYADKVLISDQGDFEAAYDQFQVFLQQGGLAKGFAYRIEAGEEIAGSAGGDFLFSGTANGRAFEVIVPAKQPFRWQVAPSDGF